MMANASTRLRRLVLAFWVALLAYVASPVSRALPVFAVAAAEDNGLGPWGAIGAVNFVYVVSIILAFIVGFGIRDALQRHAIRAKAKAARRAPAKPVPATSAAKGSPPAPAVKRA